MIHPENRKQRLEIKKRKDNKLQKDQRSSARRWIKDLIREKETKDAIRAKDDLGL